MKMIEDKGQTLNHQVKDLVKDLNQINKAQREEDLEDHQEDQVKKGQVKKDQRDLLRDLAHKQALNVEVHLENLGILLRALKDQVHQVLIDHSQLLAQKVDHNRKNQEDLPQKVLKDQLQVQRDLVGLLQEVQRDHQVQRNLEDLPQEALRDLQVQKDLVDLPQEALKNLQVLIEKVGQLQEVLINPLVVQKDLLLVVQRDQRPKAQKEVREVNHQEEDPSLQEVEDQSLQKVEDQNQQKSEDQNPQLDKRRLNHNQKEQKSNLFN